MNIKDVGIITDINPSNFLADGSVYINYIEDPAEEKISIVSKQLSQLAFESVTAKIIADATTLDEFKDEKYYSSELITFFEKNKNKLIDVVFFVENGIKGTDKVSLKDSSILFFSLYGNIKLGFFINKTVANILFNGELDE